MAIVRLIMAIDVEVPDSALEEESEGGEAAWVYALDYVSISYEVGGLELYRVIEPQVVAAYYNPVIPLVEESLNNIQVSASK